MDSLYLEENVWRRPAEKDRIRSNKRKRHFVGKSDKVLYICLFIYIGGAAVGSVYHYLRYYFGEYKPIEVIFVRVFLFALAGCLAIGTTKLVCKIFHIEEDDKGKRNGLL